MGLWGALGNALYKGSQKDELPDENPVVIPEPKKVAKPLFSENPTVESSVSERNKRGNEALRGITDSGDVDPVFLEHLVKFLDSKNLPGPDFLEFTSVLHDLESEESLSEEKKYQMAYLGFKAQNISVETLLSTADQYVHFLDEYHKKCELALDGEKNTGVDGRKEQNQSLVEENIRLEKEIENFEKEIQKRKTQIKKNEEAVLTTENAIKEEDERIKRKSENFEKAYNFCVTDIVDTKTKITQYLNNIKINKKK